MGWYFGYHSRNELIQDLIKPKEGEKSRSETIAHDLEEDVLWSLVRVTSKESGYMNLAVGESCCYIACDLLDGAGGDWGHKPMEESMHPYYYSCPLSYLDLAPVRSPEWRRGVLAYHRKRRVAPPMQHSQEGRRHEHQS